MDVPDVVVIGAGVAGLACARELGRRGLTTLCLERGPEVGGRCASRRIDGVAVDHGVLYLQARSAEFGVALNALEPAGKLHGWPVRVRHPRLACQDDALRPGVRRLARREGVHALPRALARAVDVRLNEPVRALEDHGDHVRVQLARGVACDVRTVVVACALPEALALLRPLAGGWPDAGPMLDAMAAVPLVRTLTVIAGYPDRGEPLDFDLWLPIETTLLHAISNEGGKRGRHGRRVLVLQARPGYSDAHLEEPPEAWTRELLWEASELLGSWAARPDWIETQVWNPARIRRRHTLGRPFLFTSPGGAQVAVIGEAHAPEPGVEGAYLVGLSMAETLSRRADDERRRRHRRERAPHTRPVSR